MMDKRELNMIGLINEYIFVHSKIVNGNFLDKYIYSIYRLYKYNRLVKKRLNDIIDNSTVHSLILEYVNALSLLFLLNNKNLLYTEDNNLVYFNKSNKVFTLYIRKGKKLLLEIVASDSDIDKSVKVLWRNLESDNNYRIELIEAPEYSNTEMGEVKYLSYKYIKQHVYSFLYNMLTSKLIREVALNGRYK